MSSYEVFAQSGISLGSYQGSDPAAAAAAQLRDAGYDALRLDSSRVGIDPTSPDVAREGILVEDQTGSGYTIRVEPIESSVTLLKACEAHLCGADVQDVRTLDDVAGGMDSYVCGDVEWSACYDAERREGYYCRVYPDHASPEGTTDAQAWYVEPLDHFEIVDDLVDEACESVPVSGGWIRAAARETDPIDAPIYFVAPEGHIRSLVGMDPNECHAPSEVKNAIGMMVDYVGDEVGCRHGEMERIEDPPDPYAGDYADERGAFLLDRFLYRNADREDAGPIMLAPEYWYGGTGE